MRYIYHMLRVEAMGSALQSNLDYLEPSRDSPQSNLQSAVLRLALYGSTSTKPFSRVFALCYAQKCHWNHLQVF